jgi:hypothetical protein
MPTSDRHSRTPAERSDSAARSWRLRWIFARQWCCWSTTLPREAEDLLIALTEAGLKVLVADSGPAAKQKLMREPVDLVLVDLKRADMDSFELCRQLKVPPQTRLIPVLFLSARSEVDAKIRAFRVGASDLPR